MAPGEALEATVHRRAAYELGMHDLENITCVLPQYRYTTPPYNGIIENEFCPVFIAYSDGKLAPNPEEVEAYQWVSWPDYVRMLQKQPEIMSYWAKDQYKQLQMLPLFETLLES